MTKIQVVEGVDEAKRMVVYMSTACILCAFDRVENVMSCKFTTNLRTGTAFDVHPRQQKK